MKIKVGTIIVLLFFALLIIRAAGQRCYLSANSHIPVGDTVTVCR
jgi:hypothetical protein